jgi:hypothetical protein
MMLDALAAIAKDSPIVFNGLSFVAGVYLGHRIALSRDKRQEFNRAVDPIRERLLRDIARPSWWVHIPTAIEIDRFEHLMLPWRRNAMRRALGRLRDRHREQERRTPSGDSYYADEAEISAALIEFSNCIRRR